MGAERSQDEIDSFLASLPCAGELHFPLRLSVSRGKGGAITYGRVRIDSYYHWDGGGGRTDLHDVIGILWATSLRATGGASTGLWGYEGWAGAPELESRLLFFDQPYSSAVRNEEVGAIEYRLKAHTAWAGHGILEPIRLFPHGRQRASWEEETPPAWLSAVEPLVGPSDAGIWITRRYPDWSYFVNGDNSVSIVKFKTDFRRSLEHSFCFWRPDASQWMGHYVLQAGGLSNCVPIEVVDRAVELIGMIEGRGHAKWHGAAQVAESNAIMMIPLESHCVFIGKRAMVAIASPCGKREFDGLRQRWTKQTAELATMFRADVTWEWRSPVDPVRLEQLVETLLSEEPGLQWTRPTGPSFDRDQGRDLVAAWLTPPGLNQMLSGSGAEPVVARKIVVQVKARKRSVGKADVQDVRDMLDRHEADGILLVADPIWSNDLYNYLETLAKMGYWIGLWGRSELEDRLRRHPFIATQFRDIVSEQAVA